MALTRWQKITERTGEIVSHGKGRVKGVFAAATIGAAIAGVAAYAAMSGSRNGKEFREEDVALQPVPKMLTPEDLMQVPAAEELAGPAEGRGEFEFRNRVLAGRGKAPELAAAQPRMSVIAPESVTDLGGVKPLAV